MDNYNKLEELNKKYYTLQFLEEFLEHDMASNMPSGSYKFRSVQLETISNIKNDIIKDKFLSDLFKVCLNNKELTDEQKINVEESYMNWLCENSVSEKLNIQFINSTTAATNMWFLVKRGETTFKDILPHLENNFNLARQIAEQQSKVLNLSPYDCMINKYQRGLKVDKIDRMFNELKQFLIGFSKKYMNKIEVRDLSANYSKIKKENIVKYIAKIEGLDLNRVRIDNILHPHSYGYSPDVLLGMNYDFDLFLLIYASLHECGHALYLQNLKNYLQPIGQHRGMSIHESQSIFMEKQVGKNPNFIHFLSNILKNEFGDLPELSEENILALNRQIKPNSIRFRADEVTYPLHIILRYEIERDIIEEKIKCKDLQEVWNEKSKEYLNIVPDTDVVGCLQDIHWFKGDIGYFPSYAIGTIISAQLMKAVKRDLPNIDDNLKNGNLVNIVNWLNKNIHSKGSSVNFEKLIFNATKDEISIEPFKMDLIEKFCN